MWHLQTFITCWICSPSVCSAKCSIWLDFRGEPRPRKGLFGRLIATRWLNEDMFSGPECSPQPFHHTSHTATHNPILCLAAKEQIQQTPFFEPCMQLVQIICPLQLSNNTKNKKKLYDTVVLWVSYLWRTGRSLEQRVARWRWVAPRMIRPAGPVASTVCPTTLSLCLLTGEMRSPGAETQRDEC